MIGPEVRRKIYTYLCIAACCALCIMMLPMVVSNLFSQLIISIF